MSSVSRTPMSAPCRAMNCLPAEPAFIVQAQQGAARAVQRRSGLDEIPRRGPDAVQAQFAHARRTFAACRHRPHCRDRLHLRNQARVEYDLADALADGRRVARRLRHCIGHELHDDDVARCSGVDHRPQRRIAAVAAVPIRFAIDFDGLEERRQTRRREQRVDGDAVIGDHSGQAGLDVGHRHVERRRILAAERVEVDVRGDGVAQRVDVERVRAIRRHRTARDEPGRERIAPCPLQRAPHLPPKVRDRRARDAEPERAQGLARVGG